VVLVADPAAPPGMYRVDSLANVLRITAEARARAKGFTK
jgi:hypothetical protein